MSQRMDDVICLCYEIAEGSGFKNTCKKTVKGTGMAAAGAGTGALLLGPPGIVIGGLVGSLLGWWLTRRQFKSVPQILKELQHAEKQEVYDAVVAVLGNLTWTDAPQLITFVMSNATVREKVTDVLLNFIKKKV